LFVAATLVIFAGCNLKKPAPISLPPPVPEAAPPATSNLPPADSVIAHFTNAYGNYEPYTYDRLMHIEVYDIVSGSDVVDKTVRYRRWNWAADEESRRDLAISSDLTRFAYNAPGGIYVLNQNDELVTYAKIKEPESSVYSFTPDSNWLILTQDFYGAKLRLSDGTCRHLPYFPTWCDVTMSREVGMRKGDNRSSVIDTGTGKKLVTSTTYYGLAVDQNDTKLSAISDDGSTLAAAYQYSTHPGPVWIQVWDVNKKRVRCSFSVSQKVSLNYRTMNLGWNGKYLVMDEFAWDISSKKARYLGKGPEYCRYTPPDEGFIFTRGGKETKLRGLGLWVAYSDNRSQVSPSGKVIFFGTGTRFGVIDQGSFTQLWDLKLGCCIKRWDDSFAKGFFTPDFKKAVVYSVERIEK